MNPKKAGRRQSYVRRVQRYLSRKLSARFGAGIESVQKLSNKVFMDQFVLSGAADATGNGPNVNSLLAHYAQRVAADWPGLPDVLTDLRIDLSKMSRDEIIEQADRALAGDVHPSGVRPEMDELGRISWSVNPSGSREWLLMINRHGWWPLWATAYRLTADEKYAKAFVLQLTDWIARNPLPRQKSEHLEPWRLMEAGLRMRVSWIPVFGAFFASPHFDAAAKLQMLRSLCDHGRFLSTFCTNRNHLVRESNGLIALALSFPEFRDAGSWTKTGLQRLDQELKAQVNEDGSHIEMSVGYQWLTIDEFEITHSILSRHDLKLPSADLDDTLWKLYDFLAGVIRPDRNFPQLNDGFILWGAERMASAAKREGWGEIEFAASAGSAGSPPGYASRSFPNAGLHVMRSGWDADAKYLVFDTGPYGGPHGHEDKLSFELFAFGAPFIIDPGSYTYEKSDPYRNYFVSSAGHNTVMVDQKSQVRRWNSKHMTPATNNVEHGAFHSADKVDFASGCYEEDYATFELTRPEGAGIIDDVTHRREVVFVRPDYWIIVDHIEASQNHDYDFLFHLAPGVATKEQGANSVVCVSNRNGAQLSINAISTTKLAGEELTGSEAPIQGWYSSDHYKKTPSPTLQFRCAGTQIVSVAWLLYPLSPGAEIESIQVSSDMDPNSAVIEFRVAGAGHDDLITIEPLAASADHAGRERASAIQIRRNNQEYWSSGQVETAD